TIFDDGYMALSGAWGVTFATVGGNPYLYVGGGAEAGVSAFAVSAAGQLTDVLGTGGNLQGGGNLHKSEWQAGGAPPIGGIAGITSLSLGSNSYLYATAFTDNAITEIQLLTPDGRMFFGNQPGHAGIDPSRLSGAFDVVGVTSGGNPFVVVAA